MGIIKKFSRFGKLFIVGIGIRNIIKNNRKGPPVGPKYSNVPGHTISKFTGKLMFVPATGNGLGRAG